MVRAERTRGCRYKNSDLPGYRGCSHGAPGEYTNLAQVTDADQFDPEPDTKQPCGQHHGREPDEDEATVTLQEADLILVKSVTPTNPNVGQTVTFPILLTNLGPDAAYQRQRGRMYLPNGYNNITAISNGAGGTLSGSTISWSGLNVPPRWRQYPHPHLPGYCRRSRGRCQLCQNARRSPMPTRLTRTSTPNNRVNNLGGRR
ncbi:MAG: hypothetical protein IPL49_17230 [Saprospirales bacterium]|nr:hypothetical protein [Saprospirales bacterium]